MKIITSTGFPHKKGGNYIHAEEQGGNIFVSKELLQIMREYFLQRDIICFERFTLLHRDHTAVYSSSDRKDNNK